MSVRIGNVSAPLYYVGPSQINAEVPFEVSNADTVTVAVNAAGRLTTPQTYLVAPVQPGIFRIGFQQGAVLIAGTDAVAAPAGSIPGRVARPANRGEFLSIFCSALGDVTNRPPSGGAASGANLSSTILPPIVFIGGARVPPLFSGLAPDFVGLYQVNVQVPGSTPVGDAIPLAVRIGGVDSNTVTIAVQ